MTIRPYDDKRFIKSLIIVPLNGKPDPEFDPDDNLGTFRGVFNAFLFLGVACALAVGSYLLLR